MSVITPLFIIKSWHVEYIYITQLLPTFSSSAFSCSFLDFQENIGEFFCCFVRLLLNSKLTLWKIDFVLFLFSHKIKGF